MNGFNVAHRSRHNAARQCETIQNDALWNALPWLLLPMIAAHHGHLLCKSFSRESSPFSQPKMSLNCAAWSSPRKIDTVDRSRLYCPQWLLRRPCNVVKDIEFLISISWANFVWSPLVSVSFPIEQKWLCRCRIVHHSIKLGLCLWNMESRYVCLTMSFV